jgi:hypothetical protein
VRQTIEGARADHGDTMHNRRIDAGLSRDAHISCAQGVERDRKAAGSRPRERGKNVCRDRKRDERAAADIVYPKLT